MLLVLGGVILLAAALFTIAVDKLLSAKWLPVGTLREHLYYTEPVLILSELSLEDATRRLQDRVGRAATGASGRDGLFGRVRNGRFTLLTLGSVPGPALPVMSGKIFTSSDDGRTYLDAVIRSQPVVRMIMSFWLGVTGLWSLIATPGALVRFIGGDWPELLGSAIPIALFYVAYTVATRMGGANIAKQERLISMVEDMVEGRTVRIATG